MRRIYLDYAASTPVGKEALRKMEPFFCAKFGNPSSLHVFGQEAIAAVDLARETIARSIGADFREVIFTSSATEANNLALRGAVAAHKKIIISAAEHESVAETAEDLKSEGVEIARVPVDNRGVVSPSGVAAALDDQTAVVSVIYANNVTGAIQPIAEIGRIIRDFRGAEGQAPFFHTDAVQAFQYFDCDVNKLGVDLMTISAHKIYGPKGAAALYARGGLLPLKARITGGGQEFGLRSGTENVPAVVGFAEAVRGAILRRDEERRAVGALKESFRARLMKLAPEAEMNVSGKSAPHILNVYFPGRSAEELLVAFDMAGLAASAGSACSMRSLTPPRIFREMGFSEERAKSSIRFSFGRGLKSRDIDEAASRIHNVLKKSRMSQSLQDNRS